MKNGVVANGSEGYTTCGCSSSSRVWGAGYVVPTTTSDQIVELNHGFAATPWLVVRPGIQYVIDPGGIKANPSAGIVDPSGNAVVFGLGACIAL